MGKFNDHKISDYLIKIRRYENDLRAFPLIHFLPYFWDSEIVFDIGILPLRGKKLDKDVIDLQWELLDLDGNLIKRQNGLKQYHITDRDIKIQSVRISRAIVLASLHPHKEYLLYLTLSTQGVKERYLAATFNIEDRDSYYMQLLILIIGIAFAFIIGFIEQRCSLK